MNSVTSSKTLSTESPASLWQRQSIPAARYGRNPGFLTLLKDCLSSLLRTPPRNIVIICAIALSVPAAIAILSAAFKNAETNLLDTRHITVFLSSTDTEAATAFADTLDANQHISSATVVPVSAGSLEVLTIDIQPAVTLDTAQLENIVTELNSHTSVDFVAADAAWLQRNVEAINTTRTFGWISIAATALATMALCWLITTSDLKRHQPELQVLNLMGASRKTLLKPLMLRCILLSLLAITLGTLLAWGIIALTPFIVDLTTYQSLIPRSFPTNQLIFLLLVAILTSFLTLKVTRRK